MKQGCLSEYFVDVACKRLSAVEASRHRSNQHEFDGVGDLRKMLGVDKGRRRFSSTFIYLNDDVEPVQDSGYLTWYDAREKHPTRSEYRLYFPDTSVSELANPDDLLVIGRRPDHTLLVIIAAANSTVENQICWLFGIKPDNYMGFDIKEESEFDQITLEYASRHILEQIGVEVEQTGDDYLAQMLDKYGEEFPTTKVFSEYARVTIGDIGVIEEPDVAVLSWIEREEMLFKTLERHFIEERVHVGFSDDVDGFIQFSLSVHNRRKARAGSSLENHLEYLFDKHAIEYSRSRPTEGKSRPDFLFPGEAEYHDQGCPVSLLSMLGVKRSCKDRWRQVLAEANKIKHKHLFTLEPGISENQTGEMKANNLQLVLPRSIHKTYTDKQQKWLMSISDFLQLVKEKQDVFRKTCI